MNPGEKRFYKGIYPVEVASPADAQGNAEVKAEKPFLKTDCRSDDVERVKAGETITVPACHLWNHQRKLGP